MALSDYLATDDLTIILGLVAACLFLLHNLYKPQSLVHPSCSVVKAMLHGSGTQERARCTGIIVLGCSDVYVHPPRPFVNTPD